MKHAGSVIFLIIAVFLVVGVVNYRESDSYQAYKTAVSGRLDYLRGWWQAKRQRVSMSFPYFIEAMQEEATGDISVERPHMCRMLLEVKLREFLPREFRQRATQEDWDHIYNIIFRPVRDKEGEFVVKRFLADQEIKEKLINEYYHPFARFSDQDWVRFWHIVYDED